MNTYNIKQYDGDEVILAVIKADYFEFLGDAVVFYSGISANREVVAYTLLQHGAVVSKIEG
jgi:hypothetical protein